MSRLYYVLWYHLDNKDRYLIWFTNETDGVVVNAEGQIPIFKTKAHLRAYAQREGLPIEPEEPKIHHFDRVVAGLKRKRPVELDCDAFLSVWNLLGDISNSLGGGFDEDKSRTQKIYEKFFWGNNLPTVTPVGKCYVPLWSGQEHQIMRDALGEGLSLLRSRIQLHAITASA